MPTAERLRHASVYLRGRKVATMTNNTYGVQSGDESQFADEGYIGHADGATSTTLSVDTIEPIRESDSKPLIEAILAKSYLDMSVALVGGQIHEIRMRCKSAEFSSDTKAGTQTGKFEFEGGEPVPTGLSI